MVDCAEQLGDPMGRQRVFLCSLCVFSESESVLGSVEYNEHYYTESVAQSGGTIALLVDSIENREQQVPPLVRPTMARYYHPVYFSV